MRKIVLKISLLIAASFSAHVYPAALAAKEKTAEEVTPGGGAAPAEKSFSRKVKMHNNHFQEQIRHIDWAKQKIKEYEDLFKKEPEESVFKEWYKTQIYKSKKYLAEANETLKEIHQRIKDAIEDQRIDRELAESLERMHYKPHIFKERN